MTHPRSSRLAARAGVITIAAMAALAAGCAESRLREAAPTKDASVFDYERLRREMDAASAIDAGGRVRDVRWEDRAVVFTRGGERWLLDLATRAVSAAPPEGEDEEQGAGGGRRGRGGPPRPARGRQRDSEPSPDGRWSAVCRDFNVVIEPLEDEIAASAEPAGAADGAAGPRDGSAVAALAPIAVTTDGHRKHRYGTASWVYGEELDQTTAMWWSPDSRWLVFYEFDEAAVPDFYLLDGLTALRPEILREGYPKPGEANPSAALLAYDVASQRTVRIDTKPGEDGDEWYVYDVRFAPDGRALLFNRTNRLQQVLHVEAADLETGATRRVVTETQPTWQTNRPLMRFLADGRRFVWETERSGIRQFELRDLDGRRLNALTDAPGPVVAIERIDEDAGVMFFTAHGGSHPLDVHLYRVGLDGTGQARLTREPGRHDVTLSPDGRWFVSRSESVARSPETALYDARGERIATLAPAEPEKARSAGYPDPELFSFTASDGATTIYGVLHKPRGFDPSARYPLLVDVYGGPESSAVRQQFQATHPACAVGFLVARIDNRGTSGRGKAFMGAVYRQLGTIDLQDQADGVRHLAQRPYVDARRVGVYGHSYGGYMAALAVLKHPDVFHAAVAGAPVTDWRNYDTIYTERYMQTPALNTEGYDAGSCMKYAANLRGRLLILHGMTDDNVHPNNAWQLVDALQEAGADFEVSFYPESGHSLRGHATRVRWTFLWDALEPWRTW
jgi:dipeptidyl-peptidase-4